MIVDRLEQRETGDRVERSARLRWVGGEFRLRVEVPADFAAPEGDATAYVAAALPLALAWLNRQGPGTVCAEGVTGASACVVQSNPWPYVLVGVVLVAVGVVLFRRLRRDPGPLVGPRS